MREEGKKRKGGEGVGSEIESTGLNGLRRKDERLGRREKLHSGVFSLFSILPVAHSQQKQNDSKYMDKGRS